MNRKLNKQIREDAMSFALSLSQVELTQAIQARKQRIDELSEEMKYHEAQLAGFLAAARKNNLIRSGKNE